MAPIGFLLFNQSFEAKKSAKKLAFLATQQNLRLDETDSVSGISIGIDRTAGKILFVGSGKSVVIDLKTHATVALMKIDEDGEVLSDLDKVRKILLQFNGKSGNSRQLIFYSEEEDPVTQKNERLQIAEKWRESVQENLRKLK